MLMAAPYGARRRVDLRLVGRSTRRGRRRGGVSRAVPRAGRDQHDPVRGQLHRGGRSDGRPPARRRLPGERRRGARARRSAEGRQPGRETRGPRTGAGSDSSARAHRRRRGEARGLGTRPVQAGRGERLFLCARGERRQGDGRDLHRQPDPLPQGGLPAAPDHHARPHLRRGDLEDSQRSDLAAREPAGAAAREVRAQRGRERPARRQRAPRRARHSGGREGLPGLHAGDHQRGRAQRAAGAGRTRSTSSRPRCSRIASYQFPIELNSTTRAYFEHQAAMAPPEVAADVRAVLADPPSAEAAERIWSRNPSWNGMLRTTCVATKIEGGHAENALPQRAKANVNCRILPGTTIEAVQEQLRRLVADDGIRISIPGRSRHHLARPAADPAGARARAARCRADLARRAARPDHDAGRDRRPAAQLPRASRPTVFPGCSTTRKAAARTDSTSAYA